jgi:hypothetical protein
MHRIYASNKAFDKPDVALDCVSQFSRIHSGNFSYFLRCIEECSKIILLEPHRNKMAWGSHRCAVLSACDKRTADNNPLLAVGKISEPVVQRIYDESIGSRRSEANGLCERAQLTDDQMGHAKYLQ